MYIHHYQIGASLPGILHNRGGRIPKRLHEVCVFAKSQIWGHPVFEPVLRSHIEPGSLIRSREGVLDYIEKRQLGIVCLGDLFRACAAASGTLAESSIG